MTLNRYWKVRCSVPTTGRGGHRYMAEVYLGVTARTIDGAIAAVMAGHPEAIIWAVNHTGTIDVAGLADQRSGRAD